MIGIDPLTVTGSGQYETSSPVSEPAPLSLRRPTRGGRVVAVAADPVRRQAIFYFGAVAGGVWKSDDAAMLGERDRRVPGHCIDRSLRVAPSDGNVIYAGTGESTIRIDVTHGDGVYKSTDAGVTWRHVGLPKSHHIGEIHVPRTIPFVYVAALGHASKDQP